MTEITRKGFDKQQLGTEAKPVYEEWEGLAIELRKLGADESEIQTYQERIEADLMGDAAFVHMAKLLISDARKVKDFVTSAELIQLSRVQNELYTKLFPNGISPVMQEKPQLSEPIVAQHSNPKPIIEATDNREKQKEMINKAIRGVRAIGITPSQVQTQP